MDVLRAPRVRMIFPRVCARPDGNEAVAAFFIRECLPDTNEIRIQWRVMLIPLVQVAPSGVGLPYFDEGFADGTAIFIHHVSGNDDAFAQRFSPALPRKVVRVGANNILAENRTCNFRKCVGKGN